MRRALAKRTFVVQEGQCSNPVTLYWSVLPLICTTGSTQALCHRAAQNSQPSFGGCRYSVRQAAEHPIMENHRAKLVVQLLDDANAGASAGQGSPPMSRISSLASMSYGKEPLAGLESSPALKLVGELMMQSHAGYSRCGMGSVGTDALVRLARHFIEEDKAEGYFRVFGAKITGGGSGGCVCFATSHGTDGESAMSQIVRKYSLETRHIPTVISGSSPGAATFDHARIRVLRSA
jgi:galactokinase